jgi:hypothetical protein
MGLVALLLGTAVGPATAGDELVVSDEVVAGWKGDAAWIFAGRALDVGSTEWVLAHDPGLAEGNPLMRDRGVRIGANALYAVGGALVCRELRKRGHPGAASWFARVVFAVSAGLAVNAVARAGH